MFHGERSVHEWAAVISSISRLFSVSISEQRGASWCVMVRYILKQRVFLYDTYVKFGSARKCRRKFRHKFRDERFPSRQTLHNLVNLLRKAGFLIDKKQNHTRRMFAEKLEDVGARYEHTPRKSPKRLAQET
jgi:hypothetical protein